MRPPRRAWSTSIKVTLINSLLRINQVGASSAPRFFTAKFAVKKLVHPCTKPEGLINQTFLEQYLQISVLVAFRLERAFDFYTNVFRLISAQLGHDPAEPFHHECGNFLIQLFGQHFNRDW